MCHSEAMHPSNVVEGVKAATSQSVGERASRQEMYIVEVDMKGNSCGQNCMLWLKCLRATFKM